MGIDERPILIGGVTPLSAIEEKIYQQGRADAMRDMDAAVADAQREMALAACEATERAYDECDGWARRSDVKREIRRAYKELTGRELDAPKESK